MNLASDHPDQPSDQRYDNALARLFRGSRYANRLLTRHPEWRDWLFEVGQQAATTTVASLLDPTKTAQLNASNVDSALRLARQQVMLCILYRDLNGFADFNEVATAISQFAEKAVCLGARRAPSCACHGMGHRRHA